VTSGDEPSPDKATDRGHELSRYAVLTAVTLRQLLADWGNGGWEASADLTLEPGEQLSRLAEAGEGLRELEFMI